MNDVLVRGAKQLNRVLLPNRGAKILLSKLFNGSTGGTSHPFFTYENLAYQNHSSDNHRKRHRVSSCILLLLTRLLPRFLSSDIEHFIM